MPPFTIRIYVPDGDPENVRVIDKMNWTGKAVVFPRTDISTAVERPEMLANGVYVLVGRDVEENTGSSDLPRIYIGQTDDLKRRLTQHDGEKDFWDWAIVFVSTNAGLNRAHITWMEYDLIRRANNLGQCVLDNATKPSEPPLAEFDLADIQVFLNEALQILPLVGLNAFEEPKRVVPRETQAVPASLHENDMVVVPAKEDGFNDVFLGENQWYSIRIGGGMLKMIKYIAAYRSRPISAVTHWAEVDHIVPHGDTGKYRLVFKGPAKALDSPIPFGKATTGAMQGPRYTTLEKLRKAASISDLLN